MIPARNKALFVNFFFKNEEATPPSPSALSDSYKPGSGQALPLNGRVHSCPARCLCSMQPAAKGRASAQAAAPPAQPLHADAVRVVAPKASGPQQSWLEPGSHEPSHPHPPEIADPAVSGPVKDSSSPDLPGAPTVEPGLGQDAALVPE